MTGPGPKAEDLAASKNGHLSTFTGLQFTETDINEIITQMSVAVCNWDRYNRKYN